VAYVLFIIYFSWFFELTWTSNARRRERGCLALGVVGEARAEYFASRTSWPAKKAIVKLYFVNIWVLKFV
jgi:hypothetical protein